jgi:transposase
MYDLNERGILWVMRGKESMKYEVVREHSKPSGKILKDEVIRFLYFNSKRAYPKELRRVEALVEVDGKEMVMVFLTNNFEWRPQSVADLYRCRWQIELFFKRLKQNLQIADFLGYSANAIRWQIWTALLVHLLMRFLAWKSQWTSHFGRIFTLLRAALWRRLDLMGLLCAFRRIRTPIPEIIGQRSGIIGQLPERSDALECW